MPPRVKRSTTDIRDGFNGALRLILFEGGAKPVHARVAVLVEQT